MKKIIKKFWGVGLVIILLSTLFVGGSVPAANGATLAWAAAGVMPNNVILNPNQIAAGTDVSIIKVAPNGDIFIVDMAANPDVILKSVNGGRTWAAAVTGLAAGATIADLVISPAYTTDGNLYAAVNTAAGAFVYQSTNAGVTFGQLGVAVAGAGINATCIALDPTYNAGVGGVAVGLADTAAGVAGLVVSGVYTWVGAPTYAWAPVGALVEDITALAYSPNFPIDQTLIAIGSTAAGTSLHVKVFTNAWDAVSYYPASVINAAIADVGALAAGIVTSSLVLPNNFNASNPLTRTLYVATNSAVAANDDVRRIVLLPGLASAPAALLFAGGGVSVNNLSYYGDTATGVLYAGKVAAWAAAPAFMYTTTPGGPIVTWLGGGAVTGATNAYVVSLGATVYVGTTGAESAFNTSIDSGANFWQTGYIDTVVSAIQDFVPYSATESYMVTQRAATNNSLWKTTDGGVTWVRIYMIVTTTFTVGVRISPAFGTDMTMYLFEVGAVAPLVAPALRMSQDSGKTWTQGWFPTAASGVGIGDLVVVDKYTMYAGSAATGTVWKTSNNGFWWTTQALVGCTSVFQLKYDVASGAVLAGDSAGLVFLSANGVTWVNKGGPTGATGNVYVAFDINYGSNGVIYAADSGLGGAAGVWRFTTIWFRITVEPLVTAAGGIVVAPDGTLYASDATPAAVDNPVTVGVDETAGGMVRILAPTVDTVPLTIGPEYERVTAYDGLALGSTLIGLQYAAGSNILYAIDTAVGALKSYTDTLTQAIPTIVSPAVGEVLLAPAPSVFITPVTGATNYSLTWNTREDWLGVGAAAVAFVPFPTNGFTLAGVPAGATIYYRVRITAPVLGPWSQIYTFVTQLVDAPAPNAPVIPAQVARNGGTNAPLQPVFLWEIVTGATGYEFQLAKDFAMTDFIVNASGANALGTDTSYELATMLDYSTTYYWRVRAISATSFTSWSEVQAFTTIAEPAPVITIEPAPTPTIIVPTPTVIIPTPTYTTVSTTEVTEKINPSYIWAIIIIGAVLVIAVIVLIIRTRRPV